MKIRLIHIPNTYNYGSAMMAISIIKGLVDLLPGRDLEFYTDVSSEDDLERLKHSTGVDTIYPYYDDIDLQWANYSIFKKILKLPYKLQKMKQNLDTTISKFDALIILGGDDFSEYYGIRHVVLEIFKLKYLSLRFPVFLAGQTVGPFTSYRKALASWFLKNSRIYTRDEKTYHYLCDTLGLVNVINSKDLAFLDIPYQHNRNINDKVKLKYGLKENSYITIVPSGLVGSYTQNIDAYIQAYVSIVTDILEKHSGIDKVVLLPHVFSSKGPEDLIVIDKIVININKQLLERITVVSDKMHPYEARLILGGGIFTIAGRMHAAVSTYQMKKPAICLSYSVKYDGVIGTGLNMKELVIECANDEIWSSGEIVSQVAKKVKYIEENYDSLIKIIEDKVASVQTEAHEQLVDIAFQLTNIN